MDEDHDALGDDPAAAFEALRAEVAALRASLGGDGRTVPDYAPTLGKMAGPTTDAGSVRLPGQAGARGGPAAG
jgi:hypothetical protein